LETTIDTWYHRGLVADRPKGPAVDMGQVELAFSKYSGTQCGVCYLNWFH
jgi:hypothetical protein